MCKWVTPTHDPEHHGTEGYYEVRIKKRTSKQAYREKLHDERFFKRYGVLPKLITDDKVGRISSVSWSTF